VVLEEQAPLGDAFQSIPDLIKAKQDVTDAFQAIADIIETNLGPMIAKGDAPRELAGPRCGVQAEEESILKEELSGEIARIDKALQIRYIEAFQSQEWKRAHDLLLHGVVKRPSSYERDYSESAKKWIIEAKDLLA
jgi:hypothetical protein